MRRLAVYTLWVALVGCDDPTEPTDMAADMVVDMTADMPAPDMGPPALAPRGRAGRWWAADLHVHATGASNDTGGDSDPASIKRVAKERGLDIVVLTDHSNSTGSDVTTTAEDPALFNMGPEFPLWQTAAMLSDATFLMVDGNEISPVSPGEDAPTGHVGCAPRALDGFDHGGIIFRDRPRGSVTGADVLAQARAAGCFVTLNHPFGPTSWVSFDWTSRAYDAVEVWNGGAGLDPTDRDAIAGWMCDLALGARPVAVGGSDNHRVNQAMPGTLLNPPLGLPVTWIWAERLEWPLIIDSLSAGRVHLTDLGAPLELDVYGEDGRWLGMAGDEVQAGQARWMRVSGVLPAVLPNTLAAGERTLFVQRVAPGACEDVRAVGSRAAPTVATEEVFRATLAPGQPFEHIFPIDASPGAYIVQVPAGRTGLMSSGAALTNPVFVSR